jgi:hypothetical protein
MLLLSLPCHAGAQEPTGYLRSLIEKARQSNLSGERYWDILVHYKRTRSGRESLVDDPRFFLAPDGKTNPEAELESTLAAFFQDPGSGDDHAQCRFVARFSWLKERLGIDESQLPAVTCTKYREALGNIRTQSAVLVFPAAHGNGPASMFGHTLIRIDNALHSDLLAYAVNYAALTDNSNGFVYTFKGLFGLYKGYYSILPYYEKVKEYNNIEHRDIWEYFLNLDEAEVRRMVMHIWELKDTYSDYYFFTENCSYNLLFLLEAARPSVDLTDPYRDRLRFWVIPSDTIRSVVESGMVDRVKYRPSLATRVEALASGMSAVDQKLTIHVADNNVSPVRVADLDISTSDKVKVLDLSAELLQYRFSKKEMSMGNYQKQFLSVLATRSTITEQSDDVAETISPPPQPDQGHLPGKFAAGGGWRSSGPRAWFTELEWRPAYHDLMDPPEGYVEGAQVNFFDVRGRYYPDEGRIKLQSWRLLDIVSLAARDRFFLPVSWKVAVGFDRAITQDGGDRLLFHANPGGGAAYCMGKNGLAYIMLESDLQMTEGYTNFYSFGIGLSAGIYANLTRNWKLNLSGSSLFYRLGERHDTIGGSLRQSYLINTSRSIEITATQERSFDHDRTDIVASMNFYF